MDNFVQKARQSLHKLIGTEEDEPVFPDEKLLELIDFPPWDREARKKFDDQAVYYYVKKNPKSLQAMYKFQKAGRGSRSNYPLSRIISLGASLKTIKKAHRLFPPAMKHLPQSRITPLHTACIYSAPIEVVQYILQQIPDAIRQPTEHVFLPLHFACEATIPEPAPVDVVRLLVQAYPEALSKVNKLGDTPIQTAQRNKLGRPEVIHFLAHEQEGPPLQQHADAAGEAKEGTTTTTDSS